MITNITSLSIGGTAIITDGRAIDNYVGADLSYGFRTARSGWDKEGAYVNIGIESLVLTFTGETTGFTKDAEVEVIVGNAVETITFTAKVVNTAYITYPQEFTPSSGVNNYLRVDLMPTNTTEFVEAKAA